MTIATYEDLIEWTRQSHHHLAELLSDDNASVPEHRVQWLLTYLADHERALEKTVADFETQMPSRTLKTWMYNYLSTRPISASPQQGRSFSTMTFEEICKAVFAVHSQIIAVYKDLASRADLPEAASIFGSLLSLEEHEAMRMATQIARSADL